MNLAAFFSEKARLQRLDRVWPALAVPGLIVVLSLYHLSSITARYDDPHFIAGLFMSELVVAVYLLLAVLLFFPPDRIGLRLPQAHKQQQLLPLAILMMTTLACWLTMRLSLPASTIVDNKLSLGLLKTTLLVGFNEELMFRGLVMAALSRYMGLRKGALISLMLFGLVHMSNTLIGVKFMYSLAQVFAAMLTGSLLLLAALATRSLLVPMAAHALYDFMVLDMSTMATASANPLLILLVPLTSISLGIYCLWQIFHLPEQEPFPPPAAPATPL